MLDGAGDPDVHRAGPVAAGGDVVVPQPDVVGPGAPRDGIEAVGSREDGVLVQESPPAHHLEPGAAPLSAHYDGPWPGPGLSLGASDNFLPVTQPALPARARGWSSRGSRGGRGGTGLKWLVGVRTAHREVETFKPARTADGLERRGEERRDIIVILLLLFAVTPGRGRRGPGG